MTKKQSVRKTMTDLEFMQKPDVWPVWPFLPLVKTDGSHYPECGYLLNTSLRGPHTDTTVFLGYIHDGNRKNHKPQKYDSFEAILAEWRID
jgi:hypothetical protein